LWLNDLFPEIDKLYSRLDIADLVQSPQQSGPSLAMREQHFDASWGWRAGSRYGEAEPLLEEALQAQREVLGPRHPDTLLVPSHNGATRQDGPNCTPRAKCLVLGEKPVI
jgi:hypothetical protein